MDKCKMCGYVLTEINGQYKCLNPLCATNNVKSTADVRNIEITIPLICIECKTTHEVKVKYGDLLKLYKGIHVQKCFPYLSADDREMFLSGFCKKCYDWLFSNKDITKKDQSS